MNPIKWGLIKWNPTELSILNESYLPKVTLRPRTKSEAQLKEGATLRRKAWWWTMFKRFFNVHNTNVNESGFWPPKFLTFTRPMLATFFMVLFRTFHRYFVWNLGDMIFMQNFRGLRTIIHVSGLQRTNEMKKPRSTKNCTRKWTNFMPQIFQIFQLFLISDRVWRSNELWHPDICAWRWRFAYLLHHCSSLCFGWVQSCEMSIFSQTKILVKNFTPKTRNLRLICFRD